MESLFRHAGINEERIDWARARMGRRFRDDFEAYTEEVATGTMRIPGYDLLHIDQVRPNTRRAMQAILATLEGADYDGFGATLQEVAYLRARQGLQPQALFGVAALTEDLVGRLAVQCLEGTAELMLGAIIARRICDGGREVIIAGFQQAHTEARSDIERMARQFSAPILPALPGVLVLPIVGAISAARAQQILDALLAGIDHHGAHTVILDVTGITDVDATLPAHLQRTTSAARLLGARLVLAGVSATVAGKLVEGAGGLLDVTVHSTLAAALLAASTVSASAWRADRRS